MNLGKQSGLKAVTFAFAAGLFAAFYGLVSAHNVIGDAAAAPAVATPSYDRFFASQSTPSATTAASTPQAAARQPVHTRTRAS